MRKEPWPPLNEYQIDSVEQIKTLGHQMWMLLDSFGGSRELALAKTNLEAAVMWAVKHATTPISEDDFPKKEGADASPAP